MKFQLTSYTWLILIPVILLVSKIERKIANPSIEILLKLAFALKVPVVTLLK
jgi:hypothetical protein